jgi:RNA polymerase sigma-70 factor (ECF subfamily)
MNKPEKQLLEGLRSGDMEAFGKLYSFYREPSMRFCISLMKDREEAENLVHEVFVKIWGKRNSIDPSLNFTSYLFTSLRNRIFDYFKEIKRNDYLKEQYWKQLHEHGEHLEEEQEMQVHKINRIIEKLSARRKRILKLNLEEGLSYAEIADKLDISPNTVKNSLVKAKQIIRSKLQVGIS